MQQFKTYSNLFIAMFVIEKEGSVKSVCQHVVKVPVCFSKEIYFP
jgi:hypothetical protein